MRFVQCCQTIRKVGLMGNYCSVTPHCFGRNSFRSSDSCFSALEWCSALRMCFGCRQCVHSPLPCSEVLVQRSSLPSLRACFRECLVLRFCYFFCSCWCVVTSPTLWAAIAPRQLSSRIL